MAYCSWFDLINMNVAESEPCSGSLFWSLAEMQAWVFTECRLELNFCLPQSPMCMGAFKTIQTVVGMKVRDRGQ